MINAYMAVRLGFLWGIVAVVLALLRVFLGVILAPLFAIFDQVQLSLPWFAILMAGVHYGVYGNQGWLPTLFGAGLTGVIAAIFLVVVAYLFPLNPGATFSLGLGLATIAAAFIIGLMGGFGGEFIDRQRGRR